MDSASPGEFQSELFQEIKRLFLEERLSVREITDRLGGRTSIFTVRTYRDMIVKWCVANDVPFPQPKTRTPPKILSQIHHTVGLKILHHRMVEMGGMSANEYSRQFGIGNQMSIQQMEHGKYEFNLSELMHISDVLEMNLLDLLTPPRGPCTCDGEATQSQTQWRGCSTT